MLNQKNNNGWERENLFLNCIVKGEIIETNFINY